jgi:DNA-binding transcriptional MerR regulator
MSLATASTPAAVYSFDELVAGTGVSRRTLRRWIHAGLLPPPALRGPATKYTAEQRERVRAIMGLRAQGMTVAKIRAALAKGTAASASAGAMAAVVTGEVPAGPAAPDYASEPWERVVLVPGLELHVNTARGPLLRRIAQEIVRHYGA